MKSEFFISNRHNFFYWLLFLFSVLFATVVVGRQASTYAHTTKRQLNRRDESQKIKKKQLSCLSSDQLFSYLKLFYKAISTQFVWEKRWKRRRKIDKAMNETNELFDRFKINNFMILRRKKPHYSCISSYTLFSCSA